MHIQNQMHYARVVLIFNSSKCRNSSAHPEAAAHFEMLFYGQIFHSAATADWKPFGGEIFNTIIKWKME